MLRRKVEEESTFGFVLIAFTIAFLLNLVWLWR